MPDMLKGPTQGRSEQVSSNTSAALYSKVEDMWSSIEQAGTLYGYEILNPAFEQTASMASEAVTTGLIPPPLDPQGAKILVAGIIYSTAEMAVVERAVKDFKQEMVTRESSLFLHQSIETSFQVATNLRNSLEVADTYNRQDIASPRLKNDIQKTYVLALSTVTVDTLKSWFTLTGDTPQEGRPSIKDWGTAHLKPSSEQDLDADQKIEDSVQRTVAQIMKERESYYLGQIGKTHDPNQLRQLIVEDIRQISQVIQNPTLSKITRMMCNKELDRSSLQTAAQSIISGSINHSVLAYQASELENQLKSQPDDDTLLHLQQPSGDSLKANKSKLQVINLLLDSDSPLSPSSLKHINDQVDPVAERIKDKCKQAFIDRLRGYTKTQIPQILGMDQNTISETSQNYAYQFEVRPELVNKYGVTLQSSISMKDHAQLALTKIDPLNDPKIFSLVHSLVGRKAMVENFSMDVTRPPMADTLLGTSGRLMNAIINSRQIQEIPEDPLGDIIEIGKALATWAHVIQREDTPVKLKRGVSEERFTPNADLGMLTKWQL